MQTTRLQRKSDVSYLQTTRLQRRNDVSYLQTTRLERKGDVSYLQTTPLNLNPQPESITLTLCVKCNLLECNIIICCHRQDYSNLLRRTSTNRSITNKWSFLFIIFEILFDSTSVLKLNSFRTKS